MTGSSATYSTCKKKVIVPRVALLLLDSLPHTAGTIDAIAGAVRLVREMADGSVLGKV